MPDPVDDALLLLLPLLACAAVGVPGGVWPGVGAAEVDNDFCPVIENIFIKLVSGFMDGGMAALTGSVTSWSCFTISARSTI